MQDAHSMYQSNLCYSSLTVLGLSRTVKHVRIGVYSVNIIIEFIIIQWFLIGDLINGKFCEWAQMKNILEHIAFFQCSTTLWSGLTNFVQKLCCLFFLLKPLAKHKRRTAQTKAIWFIELLSFWKKDYIKSLAPADFTGAVFAHAEFLKSTEIFASCEFYVLIP